MNIYFVATEIAPTKNGAFTGGLVNNVIRLSKGLTKNGHSVNIVTTDVNTSLNLKPHKYEWGTICPVKVGGKYVSLRTNIEFLLKIIPTLKKADKKNKIDIIHVHSAYSLFGIVASFASLFFKGKVIFTLYSPVHKKSLKDRKGLYQVMSSGIFTKIFLFNAGIITCISDNIKRSLMDVGFNELDVIPPVIDTEIFNPQLDGIKKRNELKIPNDAKVILYCGSWAKWKGVDLLIKAVHDVKKDYPNIILITAWGEPYDWYDERKTQLSMLVKSLELKDNVIELGVVHDIQMLMAACDIFVAPFLNIDGVADPPLSILEAMACKKTAIATKIGSIPKIITNGVNGFLVEPNNLAELTNVLRNTVHNENTEKINNNASKYVFEHYGMDAVVDKLIETYGNMN